MYIAGHCVFVAGNLVVLSTKRLGPKNGVSHASKRESDEPGDHSLLSRRVVAFSSQLSAGTVSPTTDIIFQPLMTDMAISSLDSNLGTDPLGVLTYQGPFDQTGWTGSFGGNYLGSMVTGTMGAK